MVDDVLLEVDRKVINSPSEVLKVVEAAKRDFIPLAIERNG